MAKILIVGEGVIGMSTGLAIKYKFPNFQILFISDRDFVDTCSFGPAGLFRLDYTKNPHNRKWAQLSFERFSKLNRSVSSNDTGIKLVSGYIQSDNKELLNNQEKVMGDIVYNFYWLNKYEQEGIFHNPSKYAIHFTTFASEGRRYVPWLRQQLINNFSESIKFQRKKVDSINELVSNKFDFIINCAGLNGGNLAKDDTTVVPNRGVVLEVKANWHKHFLYQNFDNFSIPMNNSIAIGTTRENNQTSLTVSEEDKNKVWQNYLQFHPTFKNAEIISQWVGLRPTRPTVRLELSNIFSFDNKKKCYLIHNYGHSGNGFTLGWGCALEVVDLISNILSKN